MKIISIKKIDHIRPNASSGTGYSEPDLFEVECDNGIKKKIYIDIWYVPASGIYREFKNGIREKFTLISIDNLFEAYNMYLDEIAEHSCPYTKEEILKFY